MAFFDEIGKSISGAGQSAVKQAKDVAEITRISAAINENRSRIADINRQIGEQYYSLHTEDPDCEDSKNALPAGRFYRKMPCSVLHAVLKSFRRG